MHEGTPSMENSDLLILKSESIPLNGLVLNGEVTNLHIEPLTYHEVNGIIAYADEDGTVFAAPSSEWAQGEVRLAGLRKEENTIGLPNLNSTETWGNTPAFEDWKKLVEHRQGDGSGPY